MYYTPSFLSPICFLSQPAPLNLLDDLYELNLLCLYSFVTLEPTWVLLLSQQRIKEWEMHYWFLGFNVQLVHDCTKRPFTDYPAPHIMKAYFKLLYFMVSMFNLCMIALKGHLKTTLRLTSWKLTSNCFILYSSLKPQLFLYLHKKKVSLENPP